MRMRILGTSLVHTACSRVQHAVVQTACSRVQHAVVHTACCKVQHAVVQTACCIVQHAVVHTVCSRVLPRPTAPALGVDKVESDYFFFFTNFIISSVFGIQDALLSYNPSGLHLSTTRHGALESLGTARVVRTACTSPQNAPDLQAVVYTARSSTDYY